MTAVIAAFAVLAMSFVAFPTLVVAVLAAILAFYFIFPSLNVEYEYMLLNHDLQIDVIYNRERRKKLKSFDIQTSEIIAPKGSPRLNSFKPDKVYDDSSGNPSAKVYAIMSSLDQNNACVYIEPDDKMLDHMKHWMGSKLYQD